MLKDNEICDIAVPDKQATTNARSAALVYNISQYAWERPGIAYQPTRPSVGERQAHMPDLTNNIHFTTTDWLPTIAFVPEQNENASTHNLLPTTQYKANNDISSSPRSCQSAGHKALPERSLWVLRRFGELSPLEASCPP